MTDRLIEEVRRAKRMRKVLGWSQERTAREIGVSLCTYGRWERGESKPGSEAMMHQLRTFLKKHEG